MTAKDIIKIACDFTGYQDISKSLDQSEELKPQEQEVVDRMLKCLDLVQNEVATEFIPLAKIEEVHPIDFKLDFSSLSKTPISIVWARDKFGRSLRFKTFADHIIIFSNFAKLKYFYMPEAINSLENPISEPLLPMRIYAYGVAREFLLGQNLNDEANIWEVRFKDSLAVFAQKKKEVKMPCRRWL